MSAALILCAVAAVLGQLLRVALRMARDEAAGRSLLPRDSRR